MDKLVSFNLVNPNTKKLINKLAEILYKEYAQDMQDITNIINGSLLTSRVEKLN